MLTSVLPAAGGGGRRWSKTTDSISAGAETSNSRTGPARHRRKSKGAPAAANTASTYGRASVANTGSPADDRSAHAAHVWARNGIQVQPGVHRRVRASFRTGIMPSADATFPMISEMHTSARTGSV